MLERAEKLHFAFRGSFHQFSGWKDLSPDAPRSRRRRRVHPTHLHFFSHLQNTKILFSWEFRDGFISGGETRESSETNYSGSFGRNVKAGLRLGGPNILGRAIEMVIKEPQQRRKNGIRPTLLKHEIQQTFRNLLECYLTDLYTIKMCFWH